MSPTINNPDGTGPVEYPIRKKANDEEISRHAEKQGISWADAWRYFERQGYDMSGASEQYAHAWSVPEEDETPLAPEDEEALPPDLGDYQPSPDDPVVEEPTWMIHPDFGLVNVTREQAEQMFGPNMQGTGTLDDAWYLPEVEHHEGNVMLTGIGNPAENPRSEGISEDMPAEEYGEKGEGEPVVSARILVCGSAEWEIPQTVWQAILNWQTRHGVNDLTVVTTGCPSGAESYAQRHPNALGMRHEVIRDEDLNRASLDAALFFIRDWSSGASDMLNLAEKLMIPTTVYREESTRSFSPWQNH